MNEGKKSEIQRVHLWVYGRVQGVGFRAFVQQQGHLLGLNGWVRNVGYDGVEVVAEGRRDVLERFVELVQRGPRAARVDRARVEWEPASGEFHAFEVRSSL